MIDANEHPVPTLVPWTTTLSRPLRVKFFLTGAVFPLICLGFVVSGSVASVDIPWQSGLLLHHVAVLLSYPSILFFFPLLAFNFLTLAVWCFRPRMFRFALLRLGIYTGTLNALMFNILLMFTVALVPAFFAAIVAPILALIVFGVGWLKTNVVRKRFSILHLFVVTTVCGVALAFAIPWLRTHPSFWDFIGTPVLLILGCAAPLGFATYLRCSRAVFHLQLQRSEQDDWSRSFFARTKLLLAGWVAWVIGMVVAWKYALEMEAVEYAKLPTTDPNCYVSAAAAHGHCRFVRAMEREKDVLINLQMKRLKFLEFALATSLPQTHRLVRAIYNRIGPRLANVCRMNSWFADLTYVGLKPFEFVAEIIRRVLRVRTDVVFALYEKV